MDLLVIADDLTGANDTGSAFATRGYRTSVRRSVGDGTSWPAGVQVGVVDSDSRYRSASDAAARVSDLVARSPSDFIYKKIDSTLRGNLVAEIDAAVAASGPEFAVVAPAFPSTGRVTVGGYHLVDGTPVAETAAGSDPDAPVDTSYLPDRLAASDRPVEHCPLETVADTSALVSQFRRFSRSSETPLVVCDATTAAHLDAIGEAMRSVSASILPVGSGGLAQHVRLGSSKGVLGVVGSVAPQTLGQLDTLPTDGIVTLDAERVVTNPERAVEVAVDRVTTRLVDAEWAVVTAARERDDVQSTLSAGREAGLDETQTKDRISTSLARVSAAVHRTGSLDGLFATGGAVAGATLDALDGDGVRSSGRSVEPGIPFGHVEGGPADDLPFVTKAGGFGSQTAIVNCLRFLSRFDG